MGKGAQGRLPRGHSRPRPRGKKEQGQGPGGEEADQGALRMGCPAHSWSQQEGCGRDAGRQGLLDHPPPHLLDEMDEMPGPPRLK